MALQLPPTPPLAVVLSKLPSAKKQGRGFVACCPAHDDDSPSLSINEGRDGRIVVHCHTGCTPERIVAAIGLTMADLFATGPEASKANGTSGTGNGGPPKPTTDRPSIVATYDYQDADGAVLFQVCRLEPGPNGEKKTFRQRRPDGNGAWIWGIGEVEPVVYRLPDVIDALAMGRTVHLVEGEKDVETLTRLGYAATTNPMGAGKWRESYSRIFVGASVVILPDNDDTGRAHAEQVAASLTAAGATTLRVVTLPGLPPKGDVTDWMNAAGGDDADDRFIELTTRASLWTADEMERRNRTRWRLDELLSDESLMRPPLPAIPRLAWRGRSTLLAAGEKIGKSTLVGFLAACVSMGLDFLGDPCAHGPVLLVALEESLGDVARRLKHFEADATHVYVVDRLPITAEERHGALAAHLDLIKPVLVVVDTLMAYGRGVIQDENNAAQMQPVVQELTDFAHRYDVAMLIVHHTSKTGGYRGSSAIGGAVDAIVELTRASEETDPTLRKARCVGRLPMHGFEMRYDGNEYLLANGMGLPLIQRVLDFIRTNPNSTLTRVRTAIGGRADGIDNAITALLARRAIIDDGDRTERRYIASMYAPSSVLP